MADKRSKVIMLPTESRTQILMNKHKFTPKHGNPLVLDDGTIDKIEERGYIPQHLYFTIDEDIKEGDYIITSHTEDKDKKPRLCKVNSLKLAKTKTTLNVKGLAYEDTVFLKDSRKIVVTTDKLIIGTSKDIHPTQDNSSNIYLPQPSQAFIEKYCKEGGIDEVLIEYVYSKCINNCNGDNCENLDCICLQVPKVDSHNTVTIHSIKNNYSREEVIKLCKSMFNEKFGTDWNGFDKWINKNL
jgi:hypothetical protein